MDECCKQGLASGFSGCANSDDNSRARLLVDPEARRIRGIDTEPLFAGELALLTYLGARTGTWHTTQRLALSVFQRADPAGRELVWKYMSMLRRRLRSTHPELIEVCRRRGYRCKALVESVPLA